jgi:hypothetical protein
LHDIEAANFKIQGPDEAANIAKFMKQKKPVA